MKMTTTILRAGFFWFVVMVAWVSCDTPDTIKPPDDHYFIKYYGSDGNQKAVDLQVLDDNSFLILGNSTFTLSTEVVLLRVDAAGVLMWQKTLAEGNAVDLEPLSGGDFIVLVNRSSGFQLLRVSAEGEVLQASAEITDGGKVVAHSVTPLADGGFMVSGQSDLTGNPNVDFGNLVNFKLSAGFSVQVNWGPVNHGFGEGGQAVSRLDVAIKTFQRLVSKDGEVGMDTLYYVFGHSNTNIGNNPGALMNLLYFERDYLGGTGTVRYAANLDATDTKIAHVLEVPEEMGSGFLAVGTAERLQNSYLFVARLRNPLRFNETDATLYTNLPLGRPITAVSAVPSLVGARGFLLLGNETRATNAKNIWLTKIDQSGAVQWSATYGSENEEDTAAAVVELPDGRIVILGTVGLADNQTKIALIKTNADGQFLR